MVYASITACVGELHGNSPFDHMMLGHKAKSFGNRVSLFSYVYSMFTENEKVAVFFQFDIFELILV